jgi:putative transposase
VGNAVGLASKLIAQKYDGSRRRAPGRPRTAAQIEPLVVRMARENRDWGYSRIEGALSNLRHKLGRSTIAAILKRHGLEPAPERMKKTTWKEFLAQHWEVLVATDFFMVLFVIELSTRKVEIAGITSVANGLGMTQVARNVTDPIDGFLKGKRYLIHDRDPL